jgi:hypothetical protein
MVQPCRAATAPLSAGAAAPYGAPVAVVEDGDAAPPRAGRIPLPAACAADRILAEAPETTERLRARGRPRVLYLRNPRGLETGLDGSINTEIVEFAGAENIARNCV